MMTRLLGLATLIFLLDQASKLWITQVVMSPPKTIEVLPVFNLVLVFNKGVSFGILGGDGPWRPILLSALAIAITIGLLIWQWRSPTRGGWFAVGLIIGGAIGNVVDRLRVGAVVDFLDFHLAGYHWPAFNVADSAITIGVFIIIIAEFLPKTPNQDKRAAKEP